MEINNQIFTCIRDGLTIRGAQYFPPHFTEGAKYPAVIVSHGFTGNYISVAEYCEEFAQMGYVAYSFSFCGGGMRGEDERYKSDGESTNMSTASEVEDLITVKTYVQNLPYINTDELILAGISQGGFVSGLTAAKCGNEISKLIMIYPALCIPDHARRGCLGGSSYDPHQVPDTLDCGCTLLGKGFHEIAAGMDPFLELSSYSGKVLILQGLEDKVVNYSYAIRARESYAPGQCHLQLIRDLDHGFNAQQFDSAIASIRQFLSDREEILTIRIIVTRTESFTEGGVSKANVFFTGYCDNEYFQGAILPGACDAQEYPVDMPAKIRAEYTLAGLDSDGLFCSLHIINQKDGMEWKPVITTDSKALAWLNHADLTAVLELENAGNGLTVRIFAKGNAIPEGDKTNVGKPSV